jgi:hypothetical protein
MTYLGKTVASRDFSARTPMHFAKLDLMWLSAYCTLKEQLML